MKNVVNNYKGMTLIELIVAIAILGVILVSFLSMFGTGYIGIIKASKHTKVVYEAQKNIENQIILSTSNGSDQITLVFPGEGTDPDITINSPGKIIEEQADYDGRSINIRTFIPNK